MPITQTERRDRLRLIRTESIGPVTWRQLMDHFGSAGDAIDALPDFAGRAGKQNINIASADDAEAELARLAELDSRTITLGEPDYPSALAAIDDAPPVITVRGNISTPGKTGIAIVGARNASANGRRIAEILASELSADPGVAVVSGLARGIDTAAHAGAIAGDGVTIAVMAGGVDVVYPPENDLSARSTRFWCQPSDPRRRRPGSKCRRRLRGGWAHGHAATAARRNAVIALPCTGPRSRLNRHRQPRNRDFMFVTRARRG